MIDIKTTIIHCKKLNERKENMINQMNKFGFIDYFFYEDYDAIELNEDIIKQFYEPKIINAKKWEEKVSLWGPDIKYIHQPFLNRAEISLAIKFGKILNNLSNQNFNYCLIFEDDVILDDNFNTKLDNYLDQTPADWDAVYFGSGANLKPINISNNKVVYKKDHPASRCADSILLKKKTIDDLASTWFPFNLVADWEIAWQHKHHNHTVYWWEPSITKQGSECGIFKSELR
jgi:hypothetical protein